MKKTIIIVLCCIILCSGCQKTPKHDFIINKMDQSSLISFASEHNENDTIQEMLNLPLSMHISREIPAYRGDVSFVIDADLVIPNTTVIPIIHIRQGQYDYDFFKLVKRYLGNDSGIISEFPRSYYLRDMENLIQMRDSGDWDKYETEEDINMAILEKAGYANNAPESPIYDQTNPAEIAADSFVRYFGLSDCNTVFEMRMGKTFGVRYLRDINEWSAFHEYEIGGNPINYWLPLVESGMLKLSLPHFTSQEAQHKAEQLLAKLNIGQSFSVAGVRVAPMVHDGVIENDSTAYHCCYEVMFTRIVGDTAITFTDDFMSNRSDNPDSYAEQWYYERIMVYLDDDGIYGFLLYPPYEIDSVVVTNSRLMSIDDIVNNLEKAIIYKYTNSQNEYVKPGSYIQVKEMRLGYTRILEQDGNGTAFLIPTWTVFGIYDLDDRGTVGSSGFGFDGTDALLVLNAIDGSVIDPAVGY